MPGWMFHTKILPVVSALAPNLMIWCWHSKLSIHSRFPTTSALVQCRREVRLRARLGPVLHLCCSLRALNDSQSVLQQYESCSFPSTIMYIYKTSNNVDDDYSGLVGFQSRHCFCIHNDAESTNKLIFVLNGFKTVRYAISYVHYTCCNWLLFPCIQTPEWNAVVTF